MRGRREGKGTPLTQIPGSARAAPGLYDTPPSIPAYIPADRPILQGGPKNGYPVLFGDNFGNSAPILTILSLLQAEIYGA